MGREKYLITHNLLCFLIHRCDNRLAAALLDAGLAVTSPSFAIRAHHLHQQEKVSIDPEKVEEKQKRDFGYTGKDQVNGDLAFVLLSDQWLF